jgi:hypothetical protein
MHVDTRVFPDLDSLSRAAMDQTMEILRGAIAQRGRFSIALSGGHTPAKMYALWEGQALCARYAPGIGCTGSGATNATPRMTIRSATIG